MADITSAATNLGREATAKARAFAETNPVAKKAKDAAFTAVGIGVMGAQKATAAVKNVQDGVDTDGVSASVKKGIDDVSSSVKRQVIKVDAQLEKALKTIDAKMAPIEEKLPTAVRDASTKVRDVRTKAHSTISAKAKASVAETDTVADKK